MRFHRNFYIVLLSVITLLMLVAISLMLWYRIDVAVGLLGVLIGSGISAITSWMMTRENIKQQQKNRKQQLAMAALEKRLEIHQEAFSRWINIFHNIHDHKGELFNIVVDAQDWYYKNCLYLDDTARNDFWHCLMQAPHYAGLVQSYQQTTRQRGGIRDKEMEKMVKESWATIRKPGESIPAGVELPSIRLSDPPLEKNSSS